MLSALTGLIIGILARRLPGERSHWLGPLTGSLVYLFYPCLIFTSILSAYDAASLVRGLSLPAATFAIMAVGWGVGVMWARRRPDDTPAERGTLRFCATMNNYVFLPLLIVDALWAGEGRAAVVLGALGGDIAVWSLGISCLPRGGNRLKRLLNPPIVTLALSMALVLGDNTAWALGDGGLISWLRWPAGLALPVAMTILGFHLAGVSVAQLKRPLAWALSAYRLVALPAVVGLMLTFIPLEPDAARVIFLVSTMPVAMAAVYLAPFFGGDEDLGAGAVLLSHLLAVVTVPAWLWLADLHLI